jgi:hypothetical protein
MPDSNPLTQLLQKRSPLVALEALLIDWNHALALCHDAAARLSVNLYYYSPNFDTLQQVTPSETGWNLQSISDTVEDIWKSLLSRESSGIYVLEGLKFDTPSDIYALADAYRTLPDSQHWILLDEYFDFPTKLLPLIPQLSLPLPNSDEIPDLIGTRDTAVIQACLGLCRGEIDLLRYRANDGNLALQINEYKRGKLKGKGLETINEPDVPVGGLDLLQESIKMAASLLSPDAKQYNLSFPKGAILWGVPGTGKSLSAKQAAKTMGVPLVAADWGGLISAIPGESESNLRYLLQMVELIAPCILYFDDFEKGFAGWNAAVGGDTQKRLTGKFLTWMQERTAPVFVLATVNRLEMLPPELIRRFEEVFFVDLPNNGEIKQIFELHLAKYFPDVTFAKTQWVKLIREYKNCTPAEIAVWVRKTAERLFYQGRPGVVTLKDLLESRSLFVPSTVRESEQILAIRNKAVFARPASSLDTSEWSVPPQRLFEEVGNYADS